MLYKNFIETIGNTPLVKLRNQQKNEGTIYAKMELMNPFGMKDRVAKQMILSAKKSGLLKEGMPIIESSSGTMACGLALVGLQLHHKVHIVTDPRIDEITLAKLESLGCEVHIVTKMDQNGWQGERLKKLKELLDVYPDAFWTRQYENLDNPKAYAELAIELMNDLDKIDVLVGSVGSGGSLSGTAQILKQVNPKVRVVAVDSIGSVIFGQPDRPRRLQGGLGNSLVAPNVNFSIIDEVHWLNDQEAFRATLQLAKEEQIFAGNSSGSVYAVAKWIAGRVSESTNIVGIFPDRGDRYAKSIYCNSFYEQNHLTLANHLSDHPQKVELDTVVENWSYTNLMGRNPHAEKNILY
ncbi:cysteine synthase family protein [Paenibacillus sp. FSL H8-0122]|uniref:cysteine synthase family protein n=1 Tax=Paenibacillus sp. FSL H8-0122 TaxID=2954510 RepID=UPI0030FAAE7B